MGSPCEPLNPRQELIAELEGLGYDLMADVPKDWRDTKSDADLAATIEAFSGGGDEPDWPDITEMVDAITASAAALTLASGPTQAANEAIAKARTACLAILNQIEAVQRSAV